MNADDVIDLLGLARWQSAVPAGQAAGYTLVDCTVAPPFRFETFELAPAGWEPG